MEHYNAILIIRCSPRVKPQGDTRDTDNGGRQSLVGAGEVECHPRQTLFQIVLRQNQDYQGLPLPTYPHSRLMYHKNIEI